MGERQTHTSSTTNLRWTLPVTAAALACLAGTPLALAQAGQAEGGNPLKLSQAGALEEQPPKVSQAGSKEGQPLKLENDQTVKVDDHMIVDLHVNDESLANVLQMLSIQSQKNIIASKNVAATITANLYGVSFYEALDAILHVNGYGYIERGNFIYVYTLEELTKIAEANRQMVWKVHKLNYLNSTDAAEFVKPLLSEKGQIKTNGKTGTFPTSDGPIGGEDFAHESTMLIFDYEENLEEISRVLAQMDTRPAQVLVEATILQTALTEANAFGVDFSVLGDLSFGDFIGIGGPLKVVDALLDGGGNPSDQGGAVVSNPGNVAGGPATFKAGIIQNDVQAFLRLLDEVSDTTIISRPNLLALNRTPARVLVGRKVGYLNTTSTDTATTQTVEFLETGTQLYVRPFISSDGMIRMELKPKVSEAVVRNVTNTNSAVVTIPDEISNELTTNVNVRDGQTIVLGGLFKETTQATRRQVPFVGDIPIVGAAFRGHDDETQRSEIIFLITPTIMSDTLLLDQGQRGMAMVERVRAGSREGLLPWSREKRTQQMVVQAADLAEQGRTEEALYKVQRALRLHKNQPDAIALRETLLNERSNWPSRSIQDEVIHGELEKKIEGARGSGVKTVNKPGSSARTLAKTSSGTTATSGEQTQQTQQPKPESGSKPVQQADAQPSESISSAEGKGELPPAADGDAGDEVVTTTWSEPPFNVDPSPVTASASTPKEEVQNEWSSGLYEWVGNRKDSPKPSAGQVAGAPGDSASQGAAGSDATTAKSAFAKASGDAAAPSASATGNQAGEAAVNGGSPESSQAAASNSATSPEQSAANTPGWFSGKNTASKSGPSPSQAAAIAALQPTETPEAQNSGNPAQASKAGNPANYENAPATADAQWSGQQGAQGDSPSSAHWTSAKTNEQGRVSTPGTDFNAPANASRPTPASANELGATFAGNKSTSGNNVGSSPTAAVSSGAASTPATESAASANASKPWSNGPMPVTSKYASRTSTPGAASTSAAGADQSAMQSGASQPSSASAAAAKRKAGQMPGFGGAMPTTKTAAATNSATGNPSSPSAAGPGTNAGGSPTFPIAQNTSGGVNANQGASPAGNAASPAGNTVADATSPQGVTFQPVGRNAKDPQGGTNGVEVNRPLTVQGASSDGQKLDTYTGNFLFSLKFSWDFIKKDPKKGSEEGKPLPASQITSVPTDSPEPAGDDK